MRVLSVCEYLTAGDRSPNHWDPYCIANALKPRPFTGSAKLIVDGVPRVITKESPDAAIDWGAEQLARHISQSWAGYITLVPIPGHACTTSNHVQAHRLWRLVSGIATLINAERSTPRAQTAALLMWKTEQPSASAGGGTRVAEEVLPHYDSDIFEEIAAKGRKVILVDDVVTSGARLVAAEHYLRSAGVDVGDLGFAVCRTVHVKTEPFRVHIETYPPIA